jgi:hypothetical protein
MTKFLLGLIGFIFAFGLSIIIMMFGWGLEPQSWGWIVAGGLTQAFLGALFNADWE